MTRRLSTAAKKELEKLEGKWKLTKLMFDGEEKKPEDKDDAIFEFAGNKLIVHTRDRQTNLSFTPETARTRTHQRQPESAVKIGPIGPSTVPKWIDLKVVHRRRRVGEGNCDKAKAIVIKGISKIDGDALMLALYQRGGNEQPDKFESPPELQFVVFAFERVKKSTASRGITQPLFASHVLVAVTLTPLLYHAQSSRISGNWSDPDTSDNVPR